MSSRLQRVGDQVRRELASLIQLEIRDPRIGMVSITAVKVSRDLAYADVYVTVLGQIEKDIVSQLGKQDDLGDLEALEIKENIKALNNAAGYLRTLLAKKISLRTTPKLKFHYDGSVARGQYLSSLIDTAIASDKGLRS